MRGGRGGGGMRGGKREPLLGEDKAATPKSGPSALALLGPCEVVVMAIFLLIYYTSDSSLDFLEEHVKE